MNEINGQFLSGIAHFYWAIHVIYRKYQTSDQIMNELVRYFNNNIKKWLTIAAFALIGGSFFML